MNKYMMMTSLTVLALASAVCAQEAMVDIEVVAPKALFIGTPIPVKLPNLEAPNTAQPTVKAPAGTANVAKGKTVTSSDTFPVIGDLEMVTDGDKEGVDGSFVELGPGTQWVQIDLGKDYTLYALAIWHYHAAARAYHDVVIQVADDADFKTNVRTIYNNDHDNSSKLGAGTDKAYIETNKGRLIDAKGVKARYVRLYSRGSTAGDMNHYVEVEVFGKE